MKNLFFFYDQPNQNPQVGTALNLLTENTRIPLMTQDGRYLITRGTRPLLTQSGKFLLTTNHHYLLVQG